MKLKLEHPNSNLAGWLVVLGGAAFLALTARSAHTLGRQIALSGVAALTTASVFVGLKKELALADVYASLTVGLVVFCGYIAAEKSKELTTREKVQALLIGLGGILAFVFFLGIGSWLEPGEEEIARREAISELQELGKGNFVLTYNRLHARLKENMSFVEAMPVLEKLQGTFGAAQIDKVATTHDRHGADVFCTAGATRLLLKQEWFAGLSRITDGHMESLSDYTNMITISDVLIDGKSVFAK